MLFSTKIVILFVLGTNSLVQNIYQKEFQLMQLYTIVIKITKYITFLNQNIIIDLFKNYLRNTQLFFIQLNMLNSKLTI